MLTYITRRMFQSVVFVFLASLMAYTVLVMLLPGGPSARYAIAKEQHIVDEARDGGDTIVDLEESFKLDKPWPLNFFTWLFDPSNTTYMGYNSQNIKVPMTRGINIQIGDFSLRGSGALTGDLGRAWFGVNTRSVRDIIATRWLNSFFLFSVAFALTLLIGIPIGVIGAMRKGRFLDHTLTVFSLGGISIPPYALSYILIIFLAVGLKTLHDGTGWSWVPWFPAGGFDTGDFWQQMYHVILPATALAVPQIARIARHTRFALLDVLQKDYIRTARAKGLGTRSIVFHHALRNSLVPIIAQMALAVTIYVSVAAPVENAFAYSGLGREFYMSVGGCVFTGDPSGQCPPGLYLNTQVALPLLMIMVILVATSTLVADIAYLIADPRISYAADGKSL